MSELQLGLIVAGILIVLAVYGFNRYQERLFRRRMERRFREQRPADALLDPAPERPATVTRIEPKLGGDSQEPSAALAGDPQPPRLAESPAMDAVASGMPDPASAVAATASTTQSSIVIDYVCHIDAVEPIPHAALAVFVKGTGMIGKRAQLRGWSIRSNEWVALPCGADIPLVRVEAAVQLADRSGAVNRVQLSTMRDLARQLAEQAGVHSECPDIDDAAQKAADLDRFCAQVDISIGCNLLPAGSAGLSGTKLRGLLESAGFVLEPNGRFTLRSEEGLLLMSAGNIEDAPLTADRLRASPIQGLVFSMDVPKVPASARVFDRMIELGRHLAQALDAVIVDDNRAPLTESGVKVIRQQLKNVQMSMEGYGIPAGSSLAARLFS